MGRDIILSEYIDPRRLNCKKKMSDVRLVPRPQFNVWSLVANGHITEDDVSHSGRFVPAAPRAAQRAQIQEEDVKRIDTLVRRYEQVLRELNAKEDEAEDLNVTSQPTLPSVASFNVSEDGDKIAYRLSKLESRMDRLEQNLQALHEVVTFFSVEDTSI